jgi:transcriptional regulator with XRE-family HTH domain
LSIWKHGTKRLQTVAASWHNAPHMDYRDRRDEKLAPEAALELLQALGARIIDLRNRQGWTQRVLADRAGLRPARLSKIERSRKMPALEEVLRLAWALSVSLEDLVFGETQRPKALQLLREVQALGTPEEIAGLSRILELLLLGYKTAGGRL